MPAQGGIREPSKLEQLLLDQDMFGHAVGVHYRGSGSYNTRLGVLVTLVTYALMLVNLIQLAIAFKTGSKQGETTQMIKYDRFYSENYNLGELGMSVALMAGLDIPVEVGEFYASAGKNEVREVSLGPCSKELMEQQKAFWTPRVDAEKAEEYLEYTECLQGKDLSIQSQFPFKNRASVYIAFVPCFMQKDFFGLEEAPDCGDYTSFSKY